MTNVDSPATAPAIEAPRKAILGLHDIGPGDGSLVGSKAASLARLARAGFVVPDGFVITTAISSLTDAQRDEVFEAAAKLGDGPLAVRSSAVAEDGMEASYAGQYDTVLGVQHGEALLQAIEHVRASARGERVIRYGAGHHQASDEAGIAVLVQPMVAAEQAGVAFTADPLTGDRATTIVTAVRGVGDRLAAGEATPDEWSVRDGVAMPRHVEEGCLDAAAAAAVATVSRRIEALAGVPQDIEWASSGGEIVILQARPMTALPPAVDWTVGHSGFWMRNFRFGEWLGDPVTPLFESWALTSLETRLHANYSRWLGGLPAPSRAHVVVNGWYFYGGLNGIPTGPALAWAAVRHILPSLVRQPRRVAMTMPPTARFGVELFYREWREVIQPRYREAVARAAPEIETAQPQRLVGLIDDLLQEAGDYFTSLTAVAGYAAKAELPLARFLRKEFGSALGASHLDFLMGVGGTPPPRSAHAVHSLDWFDPIPAVSDGGGVEAAARERHSRAREGRLAVEARARAHLASKPKTLARFERLLAQAQRFGRAREEQAAEFTLAWPHLRRAVLRIGDHLVESGRLAAADEIFFLTRPEVLGALGAGHGTGEDLRSAAEDRRQTWEGQRKLSPPLVLGTVPPLVQRMLDEATNVLRGPAATAENDLIGIPASAGRAQGVARVVRSTADFERVLPGDVLVASMTTPAWTILFGRVAAIVTDNGGVGAHASIVAREYGLPAVVGTGDATRRINDGALVEVDGSNGVVRRL